MRNLDRIQDKFTTGIDALDKFGIDRSSAPTLNQLIEPSDIAFSNFNEHAPKSRILVVPPMSTNDLAAAINHSTQYRYVSRGHYVDTDGSIRQWTELPWEDKDQKLTWEVLQADSRQAFKLVSSMYWKEVPPALDDKNGGILSQKASGLSETAWNALFKGMIKRSRTEQCELITARLHQQKLIALDMRAYLTMLMQVLIAGEKLDSGDCPKPPICGTILNSDDIVAKRTDQIVSANWGRNNTRPLRIVTENSAMQGGSAHLRAALRIELKSTI